VQRHLHFRRARPQPAGFDQRDQVSRSPREPPCLVAEGESHRGVAARAGTEAGDREEEVGGGAGEEGRLKVRFVAGLIMEILNGRVERSGCFSV
jgi:hypothetical protein